MQDNGVRSSRVVSAGATIGENILLRALCPVHRHGGEKHGRRVATFVSICPGVFHQPSRVRLYHPPRENVRASLGSHPYIVVLPDRKFISAVVEMIKEDVYRALRNTRETAREIEKNL